MIFGEHDPGVGFIVAQDDVEARLEFFDQIGFEQQGFGFGVGGDDFEAAGFADHAAQALGQAGDLRVGGDAFFQAAGFADIEGVAFGIEHPVDAGVVGQGQQGCLDEGDAVRGWFCDHRRGLM